MLYARLIINLFFAVFSVAANGQTTTNLSTYTYCINPDWLPYDAIVDGKHIGISKEYLDYFSEDTGIEFTLVQTKSWSQTLEYARNGRCDLIPMLNASPERREYLTFTAPYFESPKVLLTRIDEERLPGISAIGSRVVGIVNGYRSSEYLSRYYPHLNFYRLGSEKKGMQLLSEGKIDVLIGSLLSVNTLKNELELNNIVISGYADFQDSLTMGVTYSKSSLVDIINTSIVNIPDGKLSEIYKRWYQVSPVSKGINDWFVPFTVCISVTLAMTFWVRLSQKKINAELKAKDNKVDVLQSVLIEKNRTIEFLSVQDEDTKLSNRNYILQKSDEEIARFIRFRSPATLILIRLSSVHYSTDENDEKTTDSENISFQQKVLLLAEIVFQKTRDVDVASRWSNEEILILCPQTSAISAQILTERILTEIELQSLHQFSGVKVSIGISALEKDEDFSDWFEKADTSLRMAKTQTSHGFEISDY